MAKTPLLPVAIASIYKVGGQAVALPARLALATPDLKLALFGMAEEIGAAGGQLVLSDLFRSYDMQLQAHLDYTTGKKKAFSPPPGGSMHEAGRAFDVDLGALGMPLKKFWAIAARYSIVPIIKEPDAKASEAWHFECRGSHQRVYDYYKAGKGSNFKTPAAAMAASAIVGIGQKVDRFPGMDDALYLQSGLIRLGQNIGNLDGAIGPKTRTALADLELTAPHTAGLIEQLDALLQAEFPGEFFDKTPTDTQHWTT